MKTLFTIILLTFALLSCDVRKSVNQDFITGLSTQGDGLSCDDVYLSDGEKKLSRTSFAYGEKFYLNFDNIEGFTIENDSSFPGMELTVISQVGDTVLSNKDLYASYADGIDISPLLLQANVTTADPMRSNQSYTLHINIWDKKGEGTFEAKIDFEVIPNEHIEIESKDVSFVETYLFSQETMGAIINNKVKFNETIYMIFEGLEGFNEEDGKVFPGLSIKAIAADGEIILNEEDLFGETGMDQEEFKSQVAPNFIFHDSNIQNPITCEILIWDKKSERSIKASVELNLE